MLCYTVVRQSPVVGRGHNRINQTKIKFRACLTACDANAYSSCVTSVSVAGFWVTRHWVIGTTRNMTSLVSHRQQKPCRHCQILMQGRYLPCSCCCSLFSWIRKWEVFATFVSTPEEERKKEKETKLKLRLIIKLSSLCNMHPATSVRRISRKSTFYYVTNVSIFVWRHNTGHSI